MYLILFVMAIVGIVGVSGCTSQNQTSNSSAGANSVAIQNMAFNPTTLTVPVGTTVTWKNLDSTTHHVVSNTGAFDSGDLANGQSYSFTFNQAGTFPYHCSIHPSMTGTIVVTSSGASSTSGSQNSSSKSNTSTSNSSDHKTNSTNTTKY